MSRGKRLVSSALIAVMTVALSGLLLCLPAMAANPTIIAVSPTFAKQGETLNVTITGSGTSFHSVPGYAMSQAVFSTTGITVNSTTVSPGKEEAVANISVGSNVAPGSYSVNVITTWYGPPVIQEVPDALFGFIVTGVQSPNQPTLLGPGTSRDGSANLSGHVDDTNNTPLKNSPVDIYDGTYPNGTKIASTTTNDYGNYTHVLTGLAEGDHSLYAIAGMLSAPSSPLLVTSSPTLPVITKACAIMNGEVYWQDTGGIIHFNAPALGASIEVRVWFDVDPGEAYILWRGMKYWMQGPVVLPSGTRLTDYWTCTVSGTTQEGFRAGGRIGFTAKGWSTFHEWDLIYLIFVDPSGYVYDRDTGDRLDGVTATCEEKQPDGSWRTWPALEYGQRNPMHTDYIGYYGWDTNEGDFRVRFDKSGYKSVTSREVKVPPPVTDLDIEMERNSDWEYYFAEGTTRSGFQEWLTIQNPGDQAAAVNVSYMLSSGESVPQNLDVPPRSRATVNVNEAVGPDKDVSARVSSKSFILVERPIYFNYKGKWTGGTDSKGAYAPRAQWYFAEGTTRSGFEEYISIQNPNASEAVVMITYMLGTGEKKYDVVNVKPMGRYTVDVNGTIGLNQDVSAKVESTNGVNIVAERPMYFNYGQDAGLNWTGGTDVMGAPASQTTWYFAEGSTRSGFEEWLSIQNPNACDANVRITYMLTSGEAKTPQDLLVKAGSRGTVDVNRAVGPGQDVSCAVTSDAPVIAERPMYFEYGADRGFNWTGGTDVVGAPYTKYKYFFAEGCTSAGFDEYISLQNPGDKEVSVTITYMTKGGQNKTQNVMVPAKNRRTVNVFSDEAAGRGQDVSAKVETTGGGQIIVERPMYFCYGADNGLNWTGGTDVIGF